MAGHVERHRVPRASGLAGGPLHEFLPGEVVDALEGGHRRRRHRQQVHLREGLVVGGGEVPPEVLGLAVEPAVEPLAEVAPEDHLELDRRRELRAAGAAPGAEGRREVSVVLAADEVARPLRLPERRRGLRLDREPDDQAVLVPRDRDLPDLGAEVRELVRRVPRGLVDARLCELRAEPLLEDADGEVRDVLGVGNCGGVLVGVRGRGAVLTRVGGVPPGDRVEDERAVGRRVCQRADVVKGVTERRDPRVGDEPVCRLEPDTARPRRGRPERSCLIGTDGDVDVVGDHRHRRPAGGAAGEVVVVDGIGDWARRRHLAAARDGHLVHVRLRRYRRARPEELLDDEGVVAGDVALEHRRRAGHLDPRDGDVVLDPDCQARERAVLDPLDATARDDGVVRVLVGTGPVTGVARAERRPLGALGPLARLVQLFDPLVDGHSARQHRGEVGHLLVAQFEAEVRAVLADLRLRRRPHRRR
jgi:hypothetical protein